MQPRRPSPAMVVACIALFIALGGTSIAAVGFARRAGAVDGKSAVSAGASLKRAAGKLVATNRRGPERGKIPGRFLSGVARAKSFVRIFDVADNAIVAPQNVAVSGGFGDLRASCIDERGAAGREDPLTNVSFVNRSGGPVSAFHRVGVGEHTVAALQNETQATASIRGSNSFRFHIERAGRTLLIDGVVRQDGAGTAAATCLVYATVLRVG